MATTTITITCTKGREAEYLEEVLDWVQRGFTSGQYDRDNRWEMEEEA